ncbi:aldehyde dehydrogenase [Corynebacterium propinquum]|uniref:Aldehyde dehydrogenase n=2 Tax=Corynebacterium propinquum TaxID=43769 RepID=A0ABT7FZV9_9CORY|nr:aldehyde dehydrogenase [Corynebacterium propinquum]MCT1819155.1 aldehyde dehydrogenase [Corynebacterium propinquum]MDK4251286.1 aldehyde dehydrogenase [Corynebacterium propinquum]MDK4300000.1 aldehyde dehydrogenase [Corynebacterium propinquum]MDK4303040.1 aldehyde dehydrogenase [Corynebacterium propinquum]MDK4313590.1 aldehyde dehydrogenase [Corynebacterium propinquum]
MSNYQNYINNEFVEPAEFHDVLNPSTGQVIAQAPASDAAAVDDAVQAAKAAQADWAKLPAVERAGYLTKIAAELRNHVDRFADYLVREQGKARGLATVEVNFTADYLDYMAGFARRIEGEVIPSDRPNESIFLTYQPIGVVGGILPWNFPFFLIVRKMAPALLTGNTIVIKPSDETPINAFEFAKLVDGIGLPKGVFNMVGGRGSVVGDALTRHKDVDMISMTGSVATGKKIMAAAAENLTRVNLELGGKAPAIVLADADLDLAATAIWNSRVINTGQVCNCAEVVLVEEAVHDELVAKLKEKFESTRYGDTSDIDDLDMGPLINQAGLTNVGDMVQAAVDAGAQVVCGGAAAEDKGRGFFYQPTLLDGVEKGAPITREEVFGPVLPVVTVKDLDEAIEFANSSEYGLTSSVYTENVHKAHKAARELLYGETYINRENFEAMQGFHAGRRNSGIGGADGKHGIMEYVETHVTYIESKM